MRMVKQSPHHRSKSCAAALCLLVSVPVPIVHCQLPGAVFFFFFNTQVCFAFSCFLRGELIANNNRAAQGGDSIGSNSSKLSGLHHVFFCLSLPCVWRPNMVVHSCQCENIDVAWHILDFPASAPASLFLMIHYCFQRVHEDKIQPCLNLKQLDFGKSFGFITAMKVCFEPFHCRGVLAVMHLHCRLGFRNFRERA